MKLVRILIVAALAATAGACAQNPMRPEVAVRVRTPGAPPSPPEKEKAAGAERPADVGKKDEPPTEGTLQ
jgi:hypothetical protein